MADLTYTVTLDDEPVREAIAQAATALVEAQGRIAKLENLLRDVLDSPRRAPKLELAVGATLAKRITEALA